MNKDANLTDLLDTFVKPVKRINPAVGQIWVSDDDVKCKIVGVSESSVQVILDIGFRWASGKKGARKYDDYYMGTFLATHTYYIAQT